MLQRILVIFMFFWTSKRVWLCACKTITPAATLNNATGYDAGNVMGNDVNLNDRDENLEVYFADINVLDDEIQLIEKKLSTKRPLLKQAVMVEKFEDAAALKAEIESLNKKLTSLNLRLTELRRQSFTKKLPDVGEIQALYFQKNWELYFQEKYDILKPHLDDSLSAISVFLETSANAGLGYIACRMDKVYGFQVYLKGSLISFSDKFLNHLKDAIVSNSLQIAQEEADTATEYKKYILNTQDKNQQHMKDYYKEQYDQKEKLSRTLVNRLTESTNLCNKYINLAKDFEMPNETTQSLEIVLNEDYYQKLGIHLLRYTLLKGGYSVGSYGDWPIILFLRGNTNGLEVTFELYAKNNIPGNIITVPTPRDAIVVVQNDELYHYLQKYAVYIDIAKAFIHSVHDKMDYFR